MTLHGERAPLDGLDHAQRLMEWVEAYPGDTQAQAALRDILTRMDQLEADASLEDWSWDGSGEAELPRAWLVENWLPANRIALLSGPPGGGKTFLALQLAAAIASGGGEYGAWIGAPDESLRLGNQVATQGQTVVFASWQEEEDEIKRRLSWISGPEAPWVRPNLLEDTLRFPIMRRRGPVWAPNGYESAALTRTGEVLRRYCEEYSARLLIMDTLADVYHGNENNRGMVTAFLNDWDTWGEANGCAILLLGHPPKSGSPYSGTTGWIGSVRAFWSLEKERLGSPPRGRGNQNDNRPFAWRLENLKGNYRPGEGESFRMELSDQGPGVRWRVVGPWHDDEEEDAPALTGAGPNPRSNGRNNHGFEGFE